jgi:hypothetical protein
MTNDIQQIIETQKNIRVAWRKRQATFIYSANFWQSLIRDI